MHEPLTRLRSASRPVSFTGAGLSAPSGVATFRDKAEGLWAKHDPMTLASPEGFRRDPALVMGWYAHRRREMARAIPNAAHLALACHPSMVHITQNTDDLLERAGASDVLHLHGHIARSKCHGDCGWEAAIDLADPPEVRQCPGCGIHRARPGVVWFGEPLSESVWRAAVEAVEACDALLVVGTSAVVHPAAGLIDLARQRDALIVIVNTEPSAADSLADHVVLGSADVVVPSILQA